MTPLAVLRQLSITNFVLIDRLDVEFDARLTALTGETGAGKSIVLDALGLALGARADSASVRAGERQADIRAEFDIVDNAAACAWLDAQGEEAADHVVLRRVIDAAGKSRAQINGRPVAVAELRELGGLLLELHAQHEQQALLAATTQRALLDRYAGADADAAAVRAAWLQARACRDALTAAQTEGAARARERAALEAELQELREARPSAEEWQALSHEQTRLSHGKELVQAVGSARSALQDERGAIDAVVAVHTLLAGGERIDPALGETRQLLDSAIAQLGEAAHALRHYEDRLHLDPERLHEVESRLSNLFALARKLRERPEALAARWQASEAKLAQLAAAQDVAALERAAREAEAALEAAAAALGAKRAVAAQRLAQAATAELPDLALPSAAIEIALTPLPTIEASGGERIEYRFRSHPSLAFAPLAKVASGGELARLALAILVVCGDAAARPTLIFDEVDVGVGGRVAAQVGRKLQALAATRQVLCVTHMPQVAAHADQHVTVTRDNSASPTTRITPLGGKARVAEIARMLSGHEVGAATERMARELIESARRPD